MRRFLAALALFAALPFTTLGAMELESLSVRNSLLSITSTLAEATAPPPLYYSLGLAFDLSLQDGFFFAPSFDFFFGYYAWSETFGMPFPAENALRETIAFVFMLDASVYYRFTLTDRFTATAGFGIVLNVPLSFKDNDESHPVIPEHATSTAAWFYEGLRFIRPEVNASIRYKLDEDFEVGLFVRMTLPLYNLWSNWNVSIVNDVQFNYGIVIQARIGPAPEAAPEEPLTVERALAIPTGPAAETPPAITPATATATETPPPATAETVGP